eukprot:7711772-Pyramimonas_sp.AAC.1
MGVPSGVTPGVGAEEAPQAPRPADSVLTTSFKIRIEGASGVLPCPSARPQDPCAWWSVLGPSVESRGVSVWEKALRLPGAAPRGRLGGGAP